MPQSPEAVIRSWFDEVWNQGREDAIERLLSPNDVARLKSSLSIASQRVRQRESRSVNVGSRLLHFVELAWSAATPITISTA
jgi:hypothetical protein